MKTCTECGRQFRASSRHRKCPVCRGRQYKTGRCSDCGRTVQRTSRQCVGCLNTARSGSANPNWKGGRSYHKAGYVMISCPTHPRASNGYVFEHILVVEEMLGRQLHGNENVHHRNGLKADNRPENLEVWTRPHPAGARMTDLVAWEVVILQRYAPHLLQENGSNIEAEASSDRTETVEDDPHSL